MTERKRTQESGRHLETLMKGLQVLDAMQGHSGMTLTEIANELGLYKSRVMRLCGTLEYMGYLIYDERERVYRLGPRVASLSRVYEASNPFVPVIRPAMESLYGELHRTISFATLLNMGQICIYRISEAHNFQEPSIYQERTLYHGASGRVLLAFASENFRESFFASDDTYAPLTPYTITTREQLWKEVHTTQEKGYAITTDERVLGSIGIAAPVLQFAGLLAGSLSVSGRKENFPDNFIKRALSLLLETTKELSAKMGYRQ